jgi:hypothetical protein
MVRVNCDDMASPAKLTNVLVAHAPSNDRATTLLARFNQPRYGPVLEKS